MTAMIKGMFLPANDFNLNYNDRGSGADCDVQFWTPNPGGLFLPLGDHCEGSPSSWIYGTAPRDQVLVVAPMTGGDGMLANPTGFKLLWTDKGSGANLNGALWEMVCPPGFVALGHAVTSVSSGTPAPPNVNDYWCVAQQLVTAGQLGSQIWNTTGSDADTPMGTWRLLPSPFGSFQDAGTFFTVTGSVAPAQVDAFVLQSGVVDFS